MAPIRLCETGDGEAGFTLTELLVVLAIIALLAAAVPTLLQAAMPGVRASATTRALAGDLRAARGGAIAGGAAVHVALAPGSYSIAGRRHDLPSGFSLATTRRTGIDFFPDGSSNGGVIRIEGGGHAHRVTVGWLTGQVTTDE